MSEKITYSLELFRHMFDYMFLKYETQLWTYLVGISATFYRLLKFNVTSIKRGMAEIISCLFICAVIIPFLTDMTGSSQAMGHIMTWFACKEGQPFIEKLKPKI